MIVRHWTTPACIFAAQLGRGASRHDDAPIRILLRFLWSSIGVYFSSNVAVRLRRKPDIARLRETPWSRYS
ncbi:hypothetical protein B0H19DRAFT_1106549 [Mycena capillaripes]|nr:hypothetical protein B0H19DRAFT_1106549 [Mycena capillaripes]